MTHRERLEAAWSFAKGDRVPIEIQISPTWRQDPRAAELVELIDTHADNFIGAPGPNFGFLGFPAEYDETVVEDVPGSHRRVYRTQTTHAGTFEAVTYHPDGNPDYHWESRYIGSLADLEAIARAPRYPISWDLDAYERRVRKIGESGYPYTGLLHPLGTLARNAEMHELYAWFREEPGLVHEFLSRANEQVIATIDAMHAAFNGRITFTSAAHEMLIPPWMGHELFDEFGKPYDTEVYAAIHRGGGRFRAHCHGNCGGFLGKFADMGVDSIEPLESLPSGDVDLRRAKREVGERMLLSGNVKSEHFMTSTPEQVRAEVRDAIAAGAPGGGFTLRTSGGHAGTSVQMTDEQADRTLANCIEYIRAGLEYGRYPLKLA